MKKRMLNLGALLLIAAILFGMAIPAMLGRTPDTPVGLIEDVDRLRSRFVHQAEENAKYRAAYFVLGLLVGTGLAFLSTGIFLKEPKRECEPEHAADG